MIREATEDEASTVSERLAAEIVNAGLGYVAPPGGAIRMDIAAGHLWFIDDAEPRVVMHAYRDYGKVLNTNGSTLFEGTVAYVDHVWGPSLRHEELLRWLANHLWLRWGDLYGVYPRGNPIANKADAAIKPKRNGARSFIKLSVAASVLNARVV